MDIILFIYLIIKNKFLFTVNAWQQAKPLEGLELGEITDLNAESEIYI